MKNMGIGFFGYKLIFLRRLFYIVLSRENMHLIQYSFFIFLFFLCVLHAEPKRSVIKISKSIQFETFRFDIIQEDANFYYIATNEIETNYFLYNGVSFEDIIPDIKKFYKKINYLSDYHSNESSIALLNSLVFPNFSQTQSIGKSIENRDIWAYKITKDENAPTNCYIIGLQHAREWIGMEVLLSFAQYLFDHKDDENLQTIFFNKVVWLLPIMNPDGLEYTRTTDRLWRKNRRDNLDGTFGVDTNRNYDFEFYTNSSTNSASETYRGASPLSEPESKALVDLVAKANLGGLLDLHSYSEFIMYPWAYSLDPTEHEVAFDALARSWQSLIKDVNNRTYNVGQPSELLNFSSGGTLMDYLYHDFSKLAFAFELPPEKSASNGFELDPVQITEIFNEMLPVLLNFIEVCDTKYLENQSGMTTSGDTVTISNGCGLIP